MSALLVATILVAYFLVLILISYFTSRNATSESFFSGNRQSPWYLVAFGMIGTSLSGVTFVSVPGTVGAGGWFYFQLVLGFFIGYLVVAYVLLPLYYRYNLTSIYRFLEYRLGFHAYKWGAGYFILSRTLGATIRLYLVINVMQIFVLDELGIPFWATTLLIMLMILAYTFKGGVKTIVWTDTLQTVFMLLALVVCIFAIQDLLGWNWSEIWNNMEAADMTKLWSTDPERKDFFLKHIIGGAFITITMTGMDQEMMQKNISVKTLKGAQKNMLTFSVVILLVNALFLFLGGMLYLLAKQNGWEFAPDDMFPTIIKEYLPKGVFLIFIIGLISALFPSVDGAITALTSSFCIDILGFERRENFSEKDKTILRKKIHLGFALVFILLVFFFKWKDDKSIIDLVFLIANYTYGPLLGLFTFAIFMKRDLKAIFVPVICIVSPVICYLLDLYVPVWSGGYKFGNEILILNGLITFIGLYLISQKKQHEISTL
ncbi:MAG: sodium:solute symporter [Crocinitomicaceae bacterium]|jgi:SSS family transporter|nr:sodium:solute symporter [Crocinitomicaceae bacterium]